MGSPKVIKCTASTVSGVESSSVMISWMGSGGVITNDSRVTISPTTSSGNTYTSSLQFTYLMEGDEGTYTCNVMILETSGSQSVELQSLISKFLLSRHTYVRTYACIFNKFMIKTKCCTVKPLLIICYPVYCNLTTHIVFNITYAH